MVPAFPRSEIEGSIPQRFRAVARAHPDRPAVRDRGRVTTYAELLASVDSAAGGLSSRLRTPGPIALCAEPGAPLLTAMLASLGVGRFYVPLDPRLPDARLRPIAGDLDAAAIVVDEASAARASRLVPSGVPVLRLDELVSGGAASDGGPVPAPGDLAYVLFTSGSTGRPKGVMQSHRNVLHNVWKLASGLAIGPEDRLTHLSSPSFGASVSDIYGALLTGACVCPYDLSGDGLRRLPEFLEREAITIYHSVPSVFRSFSATLDGRQDLSKLRVVKLGGEPVLASDFDLYRNRFPRGCIFHVGLGATEMSVIRQWSARHDTPWPGGTPLGYAVDGTEIVLLAENGGDADEGEIGVIASTLAVGYWKDPALTAAAFVRVPGRPDVRLYRTGDLGRMRPDGCLLYLGRKDARVKIRGHRVETAEVEAALLSVPGVRDAAVEARERPEGVRLAAWVVRGGAAAPGIGELRRQLAKRLSGAMIPSVFVFLDSLPRTASGKVDRLSLPEPGLARPDLETPFREPSGARESAAAGAFAIVLGLERAGADDDFFELGGDSLSAVELLASLSDAFGAELTAADLLEAPTPAGLAARSGGSAAGRLVRLREGTGPPVFVIPGGAGDGEDLFAARRLSRVTRGDAPFLCLRSGSAPQPTAAELVARAVAEMRAVSPGPYALLGDCMGGVLAFAIAGRLQREGQQVSLLALLDSPFPTAGRRLRTWLRAHAPGAERYRGRLAYFRDRLRFHVGVLRTLPRDRWRYALRMARTGAAGISPPVSARRQEALRRRASYLEALLDAKLERFEGILHLVECEESRRRGYGAAWSRLARESRTAVVPGAHDGFLLAHADAVGRILTAWMDEAV